MNKALTSCFVGLVFALLFGCGSASNASMDAVLRPAENTPAVFEPALGLKLGGNACKSPMLDPRNETEIRMIRSFGAGVGDYEVPNGMYGVERGELLRINCNTGEVVGIVRK